MSKSTKPPFHTQVEDKENCQVVLTVTIETQWSKEEYEKAIRRINKEVSLPGFRKGKAPRNYILDKYKKHVEQEWRVNLAERTLNEAMKEANRLPLDPRKQVKCDWKTLSLEETSEVVFEYECNPVVPDVDFEALSVNKPPKKQVDEAEVEKELSELQSKQSGFTEVEGPIEKGHWVDADILTKEEDPRAFYPQTIEFQKDKIPADLLKALDGKSKGESFEAKLCDPNADNARKKYECSVTIIKVSTKGSPELNDEFAKTLGMDSLDALKDRIRKNIESSTNMDYEQNLFSLLQDAMNEQCQFDLPKSLFETELNLQRQQLQSQQQNSEEEPSDSDKEKNDEKAKKNADNVLRKTFIIYHLADQLNIKITDQEIHALMEPFLYQLQSETDPNKMREQYQNIYSRCRLHLLSQKVLREASVKAGLLEEESGS